MSPLIGVIEVCIQLYDSTHISLALIILAGHIFKECVSGVEFLLTAVERLVNILTHLLIGSRIHAILATLKPEIIGFKYKQGTRSRP